MLKKMVLALCLLLLPCLLLTACGGDGAATSGGGATEAKTAAATKERTTAETDAATEPATAAATEERTNAETNAATEPVTAAATEKRTSAETEAATEPATAAATDPATDPVTERETEPATTDDGICTVTFSIDGNETSFEVPRGETPVCPAELLAFETATNYCKVTGWDKEIVPAEADVTYTATVARYGLTVYDVRFNLKAGIINVPTHEGETPTPPAGYETDLSKVDKIGTFARWNPELVAPTAENMEGKKVVVYTPVYTYATRYYDVTFVVKGTEYPVKVAGNKIPVCPVDPAEAEEGVNKYLGWDKDLVAATEDAVYTAWYGNTSMTSITPAKDGAKGVLTMTYDDGHYETAVWVNEKNKQYGLRGSCMLVVGRLTSSSAADWERVFADGTLEPQCHSMSHTSDTVEGTQATYRNEVVNSKTKLEEYFPGRDIICYATPYCAVRDFSYKANADGSADTSQKIYDGGSEKLIEENYFVNRNGPSGLQSLDPTLDAEKGGWYNVYVQWFYNKTSQTDAIRCAWIDDAVRNKGWLIILAHRIVDDPGDDEYRLKKSNAETFFRYAAPYIESGDLWAASFGDATKYIRERQNTTVARRIENGVVYVDLKLGTTTGDGKTLDPNVFDYPLTVKVRVPSSWKSARYEMNGETVKTPVFTDDAGQKCALMNVTPSAGVTVTVPLLKDE